MVNELKKPTTVASGLFVLRNTAPFKWDTKYIFNFLQSNKFKKFVLSRTEEKCDTTLVSERLHDS